MPTVDLQDGYKLAEKKLKSTKTFKQVSDDYKDLKQKTSDNLEKTKKDVLSTLGDIKDAQKRFKREVKSQFENLLDLAQANSGGGGKSSTMKYIKTKMIQTIKKIEPEVLNILFEESLHAVGCTHEQAFDTTQPIFITVSSIDIYEILKLSPDEAVGASIFESKPPNLGTYPYSMNKELYERIQNLNQPLNNYIGRSGQSLFDIQYTQVGQFGQTGDFYQVTLKPHFTTGNINPTNKVGDFMMDYYRSIQVIDFKTIFARLLDGLTGMISIEAKLGYDKLDDVSKFSLLIQRVLGLCFDGTSEIDVGGTAKIGELDGFDDSFFEFTEIDLRNVQDRISNIKKGVTEFESCGDVKLPVNSAQLLGAINQMNFVDNQADLDNLADNLTNVISSNPDWTLFFPNNFDISVTIDVDFIKELPRAFITTLLSPKVLLPIMVMLKAIQQLASNAVNSLCNSEIKSAQDFFKCFKSFLKNLISKIGSLFVKELFELIRKDIINLLQSLAADLAKERLLKKYAMILKLITLLLIVAKLIDDWRKCKSVIDEILALLDLATSGLSSDIPLPLLAASQILPGSSPSKAMINTIEEMEGIGLPTGAMPDGSPNLMLASMFSQMKGQDKESAENGKLQVFAKPLAISPAGFTLPASIYGKAL